MKKGISPHPKKRQKTSSVGDQTLGFQDLEADCIYEMLKIVNGAEMTKLRTVSPKSNRVTNVLLARFHFSQGSEYLKELNSHFSLTKPAPDIEPVDWTAMKQIKFFNIFAAWVEWEVAHFQTLLKKNLLHNAPTTIKDFLRGFKRPIQDVNEIKLVDSMLEELNAHLIRQRIDESSTQLIVNDGITRLPTSLLCQVEYQGFWHGLKKMQLRKNKLLMLPSAIKACVNLEVLDCGSNTLYFLPSALGRCKKLETIYLERNTLQKLPNTITSLPNLQIISCFDNQLNSLPPNIGDLKILMHLEVFNNRINELPESIGGCSSLQVLNCSNNNLRTLPATLDACPMLRSVGCSDNYLTTLPKLSRASYDTLALYSQKSGAPSYLMSFVSDTLAFMVGSRNGTPRPSLFPLSIEENNSANDKQPWRP